MPTNQRHKTKYPGVYWIAGTDPQGKRIRIYHILFRKDGRQIEEKANGYSMTATKAHTLRVEKIKGIKPTNEEKRERERAAKRGAATR